MPHRRDNCLLAVEDCRELGAQHGNGEMVRVHQQAVTLQWIPQQPTRVRIIPRHKRTTHDQHLPPNQSLPKTVTYNVLLSSSPRSQRMHFSDSELVLSEEIESVEDTVPIFLRVLFLEPLSDVWEPGFFRSMSRRGLFRSDHPCQTNTPRGFILSLSLHSPESRWKPRIMPPCSSTTSQFEIMGTGRSLTLYPSRVRRRQNRLDHEKDRALRTRHYH